MRERNSNMEHADMKQNNKFQSKYRIDKSIKRKSSPIESIPRLAWEEAFMAPTPQKKKEFLEYLQKENVYEVNIKSQKAQSAHTANTPIGTVSFMLSQTAYIRKRVYLASLLILALAVMVADHMGTDSVWVVAAMMPFIALCMAAESARSETYGMAELEMASRFSIRSIMLARIGTIGLVHMVLLCILIPVISHSAFLSLIQTGIYLLVPYLAASVLELAAVRRHRGKEAISICMAISVMVSLLNTVVKELLTHLFGSKQFAIWLVLAVYLTGRTVLEYRRMIYQTEEWVL